MVSAISERLFRLKPRKYITPKVPSSESGTTIAGTSVVRQLRKKTNVTAVTSSTEITSVISTSSSDARIVVVRSIRMLSSMVGRIDASRNGSAAFTLLTVSITFAPGCL